MIIWLMLYFTGAAVHVGNYPDMNSCVNAANSEPSLIGVGFVKQFVLLLRFLISGGGFVPMGHSLLFAVDAVAAA
jgi:hypothetical protein